MSLPHIIRSGGSVVDLGSGAGPFGIAVNRSGMSVSETLLVDMSHSQLIMARRLFQTLGYCRQLETKRATLFNFTPPFEYFRVASYVLCETDWYQRPRADEIPMLVGNGAIIIDYQHVLDEFASNIDRSQFEFQLFSMGWFATQKVAKRWRSAMSQSTSFESSPAEFSVVRRYFDCWRSHDISSLDQIFKPTAKYVANGKELCGNLEDIRSYWRRNADRQVDLALDYTPYTTTPASINVVFQACFTDTKEKQFQVVGGVICFNVDTKTSLIDSLTETYCQPRQRGPRKHFHLVQRCVGSAAAVAMGKVFVSGIYRVRGCVYSVDLYFFWIAGATITVF